MVLACMATGFGTARSSARRTSTRVQSGRGSGVGGIAAPRRHYGLAAIAMAMAMAMTLWALLELPPVSVSTLVDGLAVAVFDGCRSHALLGVTGIGIGYQREIV